MHFVKWISITCKCIIKFHLIFSIFAVFVYLEFSWSVPSSKCRSKKTLDIILCQLNLLCQQNAKKCRDYFKNAKVTFNLLCTFKDIYSSSNILIIKCGMTILFYQVYLNADVVIVIMAFIQMIKNRKFIIYLNFLFNT